MKTSELTGEALDRFTALAQGWELTKDPMAFKDDSPQAGWWIWDKQLLIGVDYSPSTNWHQAGELIEKYKLDLWHEADDIWCSCTPKQSVQGWSSDGSTPMEAICKCVVAALGENNDD